MYLWLHQAVFHRFSLNSRLSKLNWRLWYIVKRKINAQCPVNTYAMKVFEFYRLGPRLLHEFRWDCEEARTDIGVVHPGRKWYRAQWRCLHIENSAGEQVWTQTTIFASFFFMGQLHLPWGSNQWTLIRRCTRFSCVPCRDTAIGFLRGWGPSRGFTSILNLSP